MVYLYLQGRLAIQPEVAHQTSLIKNEYSIAILGILESGVYINTALNSSCFYFMADKSDKFVVFYLHSSLQKN